MFFSVNRSLVHESNHFIHTPTHKNVLFDSVNDLCLQGYAQVVSTLLADFNREYGKQSTETQTGWFSALASMVGNMFVPEERQIELVRSASCV